MKYLISSILSKAGFVLKRRHKAKHKLAQNQNREWSYQMFMDSIHGCNIYDGFDANSYGFDASGWGSEDPLFGELVRKIKPSVILEVGSWKGGSALTFAQELDMLGHGTLVCIDTWLGAVEFREDKADKERFISLNCRNGFPQVYFQFLANVVQKGLAHRVVPFPMDSCSAALWLMKAGVSAQLIYIDGSHEEEDVERNLIDYFALLEPNGALIGDDWNWVGVRTAAESFSRSVRRQIHIQGDKWYLVK